jgi:Polyketide cyclase / dehydrase and lipid transport
MRIKVSTTIDTPIGAVWDYVENISSHVEWMADAESIEFISSRHTGVGTAFICVTKVGPFRLRDKMTVTQWSSRRAMGIRHEGVVTGEGVFTLSKRRGGRTRFTWKERLTFPLWMGGPAGALCAKPILRWIWKRNLRRLKAQCENGR